MVCEHNLVDLELSCIISDDWMYSNEKFSYINNFAIESLDHCFNYNSKKNRGFLQPTPNTL